MELVWVRFPKSLQWASFLKPVSKKSPVNSRKFELRYELNIFGRLSCLYSLINQIEKQFAVRTINQALKMKELQQLYDNQPFNSTLKFLECNFNSAIFELLNMRNIIPDYSKTVVNLTVQIYQKITSIVCTHCNSL